MTSGWFDADAHVIEPPWVWQDYTERRFHDRVPRLERRGDADWLVGGEGDLFPIARLGGLARGDRSLPLGATDGGRWDDAIVPGAYRVEDRLAAMALDGVTHALLYPTVAMTFYALRDVELRWALLHAYNRWTADLCAESGGALSSVCLIDPDDLERSRAEIATARERGHVAILVPLWSDDEWGYSDDRYLPLWALAADHGIPVGFHAFASRTGHRVVKGEALARDAVAHRPAAVASAFAQLIFNGVFERVPALRWFSAENDAGWCAYFVERADTLFARAAAQFPIRRPPSEQFREHVFVTFTSERVAVANVAIIGASNMMWGSDYPHNVTTWPGSRALVEGLFDEFAIAPAARDALTSGTARRLFA